MDGKHNEGSTNEKESLSYWDANTVYCDYA
jgi:hypothetical protein